MKNIKKLILGVGALLLIMTSCSSDEMKYEPSVVRDYELQLNGNPWNINVGISTRPIFIYKDNGDYFGNYSSLYRFALEKGSYKFIATDIPAEMVPLPVNLNDFVVPQSINADQAVKLSAVVPYASPFDNKLTLNIVARSGILRLKSKDIVADPSYTVIKTTVFVKRNGYKVADESYVQGDMSVSRSKKTTTGGINYLDDFIVFQTDEVANNVKIRIEFMTDDLVVVKTKEIEGSFPILGNGVTNIDFNLNDPDTPIIKDYVVTINGVVQTK
ncbi:hypothetical protein [Flavobacterium fluviatile]|uniref:hypothetical protein n=1 Tax=Flavobacterium fluviatile TaxID=1862387 RepID=UPI0013D023BF|nr:hypothetical protein [Flavobacterium fluviatile]